MASAWLSLCIPQGGATTSNSFCCWKPEETLGDVVGREVKKKSDSSSVSEVKTKDGVSCPLNIQLKILMERGMLDLVAYLISDFQMVNRTSSALDRLMSSANGDDVVTDKKLYSAIFAKHSLCD